MSALESYLIRLTTMRNATVPETSHYAALKDFLDDCGAALKPAVHALIHPKDMGAGIPDLGLFVLTQPDDQKPERGVIEAKPLSADLNKTTASDQVKKYLAHYGQVLVTNFYQFTLVTRGKDGQPQFEESYALAQSESAFWHEMHHPRAFAQHHDHPLREYLLRVMRRPAPLADPRDVAWMLASYARVARLKVSQAGDLAALNNIRADMERALDFKFDEDQGDQFFRSTLIQTLFYGVFSAWVAWHESHPPADERFDLWKHTRTESKAVIRDLFRQITDPAHLQPLGLEPLLNWTTDALNRVDRPAFFEVFNTGHAIQYFYEPFLKEFDPQLRDALGVWYTPPEIVEYMVARVDIALQTELGIADGLADNEVVILDPCCGTGAYLGAVARRIYDRVKLRRGELQAAQAVKQALRDRIFGFELLPAPFVVAHLQLDLILHGWGISFNHDERAAVYLTNALTGWSASSHAPKTYLMQGLETESAAARKIKHARRILVVIGNPPYNAYAGTSAEAEGNLIEDYKTGLTTTWGIKKFNLDDLFVRFFRVAEHCIADLNQTRQGIICYISPFSYLDKPSYVVMRERFLKSFHHLWLDNLNGDSRETGKVIPEGKQDAGSPDPSVFSTDSSPEGIRVGTAVSLLVRKPEPVSMPEVHYREFWGTSKRAELLASLNDPHLPQRYQRATPTLENRFSFRPLSIRKEYQSWAKLSDLCAISPFNGPVERRGFALISVDRQVLFQRMASYFDKSIADDEIRKLHPKLMMDGNRIVGQDARRKILSAFTFEPRKISRYPLKPLDMRWCYLDNLRPLFSEPSPELLALRDIPNNEFLITRDSADKENEGSPFYYSPLVCDYDFLSGHARHIPIFVKPKKGKSLKRNARQAEMFKQGQVEELTYIANLSPLARAYLARLGFTHPDTDPDQAALIWLHALAIGYASDYLTQHADGIKSDYPRIPLPEDASLLRASAALGRHLADLLNTEKPIPGVTAGDIRPDLAPIAILKASGAPDYALRAGWGNLSRGAVMPGKGKLTRHPNGSLDVYLNDTTYWANLPASVWDYTIGGYQVIKKWLSYREFPILGRPLTSDEINEVTDMARRIAALCALQPALNANYAACLL